MDDVENSPNDAAVDGPSWLFQQKKCWNAKRDHEPLSLVSQEQYAQIGRLSNMRLYRIRCLLFIHHSVHHSISYTFIIELLHHYVPPHVQCFFVLL